jgi:5'-3' exonuclease
MKPKKLIAVDFNNMMYMVTFNNYLVEKYKGHTTEQLTAAKMDELTRDSLKLVFFKIFNILEWNQEYDVDILFAKDGYRLWRRERLFQEYKAHRKTARDASTVNFDLVFQVFDKIWTELKSILPFRFITLDGIETDDIIYETILSEYDRYDKFQIYSADADFVQLLRHDKVELYNPRTRKFHDAANSEFELFEKIIRGDKSDGIPNIYSESVSERQKPIFTTRLKSWFDNKNEFKEFIKAQPKETQKRFIRNKRLIDMRDIPEDIKEKIRTALNEPRTKFDLKNYFGMAKNYHIQSMEDQAELIPQWIA